MAFIRIIATLESDSNLPEDNAVNVWHFDSDQTFAEDGDDTADRLTVFYQAIDSRLSALVTASNMTLDVYNLSDPPPRVPAITRSVALTGGTATALPEEVAIVCSMSAAAVSGENPRRRRGRVYIGPLDSSVVDTVDGRIRVSSAVRTQFADAMEAVAEGPDPGDARLAVFSPTTAGLPEPAGGWTDVQLAAGFNDVTNGWVDNAFDTQRRRGSVPTVRTVWSL